MKEGMHFPERIAEISFFRSESKYHMKESSLRLLIFVMYGFHCPYMGKQSRRDQTVSST